MLIPLLSLTVQAILRNISTAIQQVEGAVF